MDVRVEHTIRRMNEQLHCQLTVRELASAVGLSISQLTRLFRIHTGMTPGVFSSTSDDDSSHSRRGNVVDDSRGDDAGGRLGPQPFRTRLPTCPWPEPACPSSAAAEATECVLLKCDDIRSLAHRVHVK